MTSDDDDWLGLLTGAIANPLTLGGIGLMSEGFQGLNQGIKTGLSYQEQQAAMSKARAKLAQQAQAKKTLGSLPPELVSMLPPGFAPLVGNLDPEDGTNVLIKLLADKRAQDQDQRDYELRKSDSDFRREEASRPQFIHDKAGVGYFDPKTRQYIELEDRTAAAKKDAAADIASRRAYLESVGGNPDSPEGRKFLLGGQYDAGAEVKFNAARRADLNVLSGLEQSMDYLGKSAREANNEDLARVTGFNSYIPNLAGGKAADQQGRLDNLKAQAITNTLAEMRAASKTGGALGSVTERELPILENKIANLNQAQSKEQYAKALNDIYDYSEAVKKRMRDNYEASYGAADRNSSAVSAPPPPDDPLRLR